MDFMLIFISKKQSETTNIGLFFSLLNSYIVNPGINFIL